jgi:hypothetical protein
VADNNLDKLREHLFATLDALRDPTNPMDLERAKAIGEVAQTVINTAKVEVDHLRLVGGEGKSAFLSGGEAAPALDVPPLPEGVQGTVTGIRRHRLEG